MTPAETTEALAALESALGRAVSVSELLLLAGAALARSRNGMVVHATPTRIVLAREIVAPAPDAVRGERFYQHVGSVLAWRNADDIVHAVGDAIGRAIEAEINDFGGGRVPEDAGYDLDTLPKRIAAQLRYDGSHLKGALDLVLGDVLADAEDLVAESGEVADG